MAVVRVRAPEVGGVGNREGAVGCTVLYKISMVKLNGRNQLHKYSSTSLRNKQLRDVLSLNNTSMLQLALRVCHQASSTTKDLWVNFAVPLSCIWSDQAFSKVAQL